MSHKTKIFHLEKLLEGDLNSFLPVDAGFDVHLESFKVLELGGRRVEYLSGPSLEEFQENYREGRAPLFVPLSARVKVISSQEQAPMTLELSPFGPLKPTYLGENPFKPYVLTLLQRLTKKTIC